MSVLPIPALSTRMVAPPAFPGSTYVRKGHNTRQKVKTTREILERATVGGFLGDVVYALDV